MEEPNLPDPNLPPPQKPRNWWLIIGAIIIPLLLLVGGILFFNQRSTTSPEITVQTIIPTLAPTNIPPIIPTTKPLPPTKPTLSPIPSSTSIPKSGVTFHFKTQSTSEPTDQLALEIMKPDFSTVLTQNLTENKFTATDLAPGNYYVYVRAGDTDSNSYCGSNNTGSNLNERTFSIELGKQKNIDVNLYPYPGFVYLKTPGGFPVSDATVAVTDSSGNNIYYSTTSDQLGRAVVYTVNPNPHWLKITKNGQNYSQKISTNGCFWTEIVKPNFSFPLSQVTINISSTVDYLSLTPELIIPRSPDPGLTKNSLGNTLNTDGLFTWGFDQTKCSGLGFGAFRFGNQVSLYPSPPTNSVTLTEIPPGNYTICVFESGKPGVYWASSTVNIAVSAGENQSVTITYPKP